MQNRNCFKNLLPPCSLILVSSGLLIFTIPAHAAGIDLGAASNFAIFGLANSNDHLSSGPLVVNGNIGVGPNAQFKIDGGGTINGTIYADPTATINAPGYNLQYNANVVGAAISSINALVSQVKTDALSPTQTFSSITNPITITGNGGLNVINVTNNIALSGGNFTISGGPNDTFIFDVQGSGGAFHFSGGTNMLLQGVNPDQVLFYMPNGTMQTDGHSDTDGIFVDPNGIQINGGVHNSEFIFGGQFSAQSNPMITHMGVPEPGTLSLAAFALATFGLLVRRLVARPPKD